MSKIKLLSIAVVGLLVINIAVVGFLLLRKPPLPADGGPPASQGAFQPRGQEGPKAIVIERLHFNDEQTAQYELLIKEHQTGIRLLNDSVRKVKNDLYHTLSFNDFSGKDSLVARLGFLQKRIELTHYDHFVAIKKLCTKEQQENFNKLTSELARFFASSKEGHKPPEH